MWSPGELYATHSPRRGKSTLTAPRSSSLTGDGVRSSTRSSLCAASCTASRDEQAVTFARHRRRHGHAATPRQRQRPPRVGGARSRPGDPPSSARRPLVGRRRSSATSRRSVSAQRHAMPWPLRSPRSVSARPPSSWPTPSSSASAPPFANPRRGSAGVRGALEAPVSSGLRTRSDRMVFRRLFGGGSEPKPEQPTQVSHFDTAAEGDRLIVEQLRSLGADLSKPREVLHYVYLPSQDAAQAAGPRAAGEGLRRRGAARRRTSRSESLAVPGHDRGSRIGRVGECGDAAPSPPSPRTTAASTTAGRLRACPDTERAIRRDRRGSCHSGPLARCLKRRSGGWRGARPRPFRPTRDAER